MQSQRLQNIEKLNHDLASDADINMINEALDIDNSPTILPNANDNQGNKEFKNIENNDLR